jgi:hypothetical protein
MVLASRDVKDSRRAAEVKEVPTLAEIKSKLPAHCFKANTGVSVGYLIRDLAMFSVLLVLSFAAWSYLSFTWLLLVSPVLIFAQGMPRLHARTRFV